jgi:hypothetical protein
LKSCSDSNGKNLLIEKKMKRGYAYNNKIILLRNRIQVPGKR